MKISKKLIKLKFEYEINQARKPALNSAGIRIAPDTSARHTIR